MHCIKGIALHPPNHQITGEKEEFTPAPYTEIKEVLFTMKEGEEEIGRADNDKYLPFENAEMRQGK